MEKTKRVYCDACFGTGYRGNAYGRPKCDKCDGNGYTWRKVRKYTKKEKPVKIISSNPPVIKSFFCGLKADGNTENKCEFQCRYCRLGKHPQKYV